MSRRSVRPGGATNRHARRSYLLSQGLKTVLSRAIGLLAQVKCPAALPPNQFCLLIVGRLAVDKRLHLDMRVILPSCDLPVLVLLGLVLELQLGRVRLHGPYCNVVFAVAGIALIDREQVFCIWRQRRKCVHDCLATGASADEQVGAALVKQLSDQVRLGSWKVFQHYEDEALRNVDIFAITCSSVADVYLRLPPSSLRVSVWPLRVNSPFSLFWQ